MTLHYIKLVQRGPLGPVLVQRNGTTHFKGPSKGCWALGPCPSALETAPHAPRGPPLSTGGVHGLVQVGNADVGVACSVGAKV